jgi:uncharacterized protein YbjT (DUF2867 family)
VTGGTGYLGRPLIERLLAKGHCVKALVRPGSERKLPAGVEVVPGDALDSRSYVDQVDPGGTFVHLVGTPHPAPWKEKQFRTVDLKSAMEAGKAAQCRGVSNFVYISVANPAPVMRRYIRVRLEAEAFLTGLGLNCTFVRPWYVVGPGHRLPLVTQPFWNIAGSLVPAWRDTGRRLALVTQEQMVNALANAVEDRGQGVRYVEVAEIRRT